jgi:hypothetical protein
MIHIKIKPINRSGDHRDLYFYLPFLQRLIITDSYYYREFNEIAPPGTMDITDSIVDLLQRYLAYGQQQIQSLTNTQTIYLPLEFYDQATQGLRISILNEEQLNVNYVFKKEGGYQIVGGFKDTIRVFDSSDDFGLQPAPFLHRCDRAGLLKAFQLASQHIQVVEDFSFLYTWTV